MNRFTRFAAAGLLGASCCAGAMHWLGTSARGEANYSLTSPAPKFVMRTLGVNADFLTYRVDAAAGTVWYASAGKWVKVVEDTPPGAGLYDLHLFGVAGNTSYDVVRTDLSTGRAWYLSNSKLVLIAEQ